MQDHCVMFYAMYHALKSSQHALAKCFIDHLSWLSISDIARDRTVMSSEVLGHGISPGKAGR